MKSGMPITYRQAAHIVTYNTSMLVLKFKDTKDLIDRIAKEYINLLSEKEHFDVRGDAFIGTGVPPAWGKFVDEMGSVISCKPTCLIVYNVKTSFGIKQIDINRHVELLIQKHNIPAVAHIKRVGGTIDSIPSTLVRGTEKEAYVNLEGYDISYEGIVRQVSTPGMVYIDTQGMFVEGDARYFIRPPENSFTKRFTRTIPTKLIPCLYSGLRTVNNLSPYVSLLTNKIPVTYNKESTTIINLSQGVIKKATGCDDVHLANIKAYIDRGVKIIVAPPEKQTVNYIFVGNKTLIVLSCAIPFDEWIKSASERDNWYLLQPTSRLKEDGSLKYLKEILISCSSDLYVRLFSEDGKFIADVEEVSPAFDIPNIPIYYHRT